MDEKTKTQSPVEENNQVPPMIPGAQKRVLEFFKLLDKWDKEAKENDRPGQD